MQPITIRGARQHNLKNIEVRLPRRRLVVVSGVSGSGKSSLVFDTLYAEGQRRYVESLSTYTKQFLERMQRPEVDEVSGISPAIAIRQQNHVKSARSTVGTATEVYDYLRLLFARVGQVHCPQCGEASAALSPSAGAQLLLARFPAGARLVVLFALPRTAGSAWTEVLEPLRGAGFARLWVDGASVDLEPPPSLPAALESVEVVVDRIVARPESRARLAEALETAYRAGNGAASVVEAESGERQRLDQRGSCVRCRLDLPRPSPGMFSFNSPLGACPDCRGFGNRLEFDERLIVPEPERTLADGAIAPWGTGKFEYYARRLEEFCRRQRIPWQTPWCELPRPTQKAILEGTQGFKGVIPFLEGLRAKGYKKYARFFTRRFMEESTCRSCAGGRLQRQALCVRVGGLDIAALSRLTLEALRAWVDELALQGEAEQVAADIVAELRARLDFLCAVGVEYLTLDRLTRTLSGGEAQRINLASALGSNLVDALYILDEPTVGMHARDTERLVRTLERLRDLGNTVVVVEHDPDVIAAADYFVDLGPGAGVHGGEVVFAGALAGLRTPDGAGLVAESGSVAASRTLAYLTGAAEIQPRPRRRQPGSRWLELGNARLHNLKGVDVRIPVGLFVTVSGVSGSGKSTLVTEVLHRALTGQVPPSRGATGWYDSLRGAHLVHDVVLVDAAPIGRTPRSNPLSYMKGTADVRSLFAATSAARLARFGPGHFSFNTQGGRCEHCEGMGSVQIEMHFMADLFVPCEHCEGKRFKPEVLAVEYRGRNIAEVLEMTVDEAMTFFHESPGLGQKLHLLKRAGLGYLRLGQAAPTLSGGESQRLKIARALAATREGNMLYLLDEPTTGLHLDDVSRLLRILHELVERGHTLVLVEHHLDVVAASDWVIDLGPEAGAGGGEIVYAGPPEGLLEVPRSWTGRCLRRHLEAGGRTAPTAATG
ncbi:MAG TPA: excinuclease ABC subunit UvrA [Candidatus Krumholzibacteria bacterium]|nr:excinuclease ABC subunit UvrA [Candidatus Krumholzibacteria bacterium]